ncbi:DUF6290 family protein [Kriegella aquimaris]|uniref:Uncharacterized protein n=1 Tax=Kriegella aquimaris TaxID=192904 RepID=A0A1G9V015_9FLAO|nr:DUF6290 family protein [Kriegella aquimaris]SDM65478.1 hypothetical protein SAMN04488514_11251 [Kriegella aquimaris]
MNTTINLRVSNDQKTTLQNLAEDFGCSLSDYIRDVITTHLEDSYEELDEPSINLDLEPIILDEGRPIPGFEKSYEFTTLLAWLFYKYMQPTDNNSIEAINGIKYKVEKTLKRSSFSQDLKLEFLKVLSDLNRFVVEPDYSNKHFTFPISGNALSFDYCLLINELWSLENKEL